MRKYFVCRHETLSLKVRHFRIHDSQLQAVSLEVPNVKLVFSAFTSMNPSFHRSLTFEMPDLLPKRRTQLRVMVNAGLQGGVPWLRNSCKSICPICKSEEEDNYHFLLCCKGMRPEFDLFWSKLFSLIQTKATFKADVIINFLRNLDNHSKVFAPHRWPKATLPALYKRIHCSIYYGVSSQACQDS